MDRRRSVPSTPARRDSDRGPSCGRTAASPAATRAGPGTARASRRDSEGSSCPACQVADSATNGLVIDGTYNIPVSGSNAAPVQSAPPTVPGIWIVPFLSPGPGPAMRPRRVNRSGDVLLRHLQRFRPELRREVDEIVVGDALPIERRRPRRNRLRRATPFHPGTVEAGTGRLFDRPHRLAGDAIAARRRTTAS